MTTRFGRREFLADAGRRLAALATAGLAGAAGGCQTRSDCNQEDGGCLLMHFMPPTMVLACRDAHLAATGAPDCWLALAAIDAEGVEVLVGDDLSLPNLYHPVRHYSIATAEEIERLRADLAAAGMRISALCMANQFDRRPDFELEWVARTAEAARALGVGAIRIDVVPRQTSPAEFPDFAAGMLQRVIAATEASGVALGIENHGTTTNDPEFLRALFERVGSDRLGLTLDTANFYWFGHPLSRLYELYEQFAPRVKHTHCKNIRYPESEHEKQRPMGWEYAQYNCPLDEGDIDLRRVIGILRAAGYTGDLCVENEALGKLPAAERGAVLARELRFLGECRQAAGQST